MRRMETSWTKLPTHIEPAQPVLNLCHHKGGQVGSPGGADEVARACCRGEGEQGCWHSNKAKAEKERQNEENACLSAHADCQVRIANVLTSQQIKRMQFDRGKQI